MRSWKNSKTNDFALSCGDKQCAISGIFCVCNPNNDIGVTLYHIPKNLPVDLYHILQLIIYKSHKINFFFSKLDKFFYFENFNVQNYFL